MIYSFVSRLCDTDFLFKIYVFSLSYQISVSCISHPHVTFDFFVSRNLVSSPDDLPKFLIDKYDFVSFFKD